MFRLITTKRIVSLCHMIFKTMWQGFAGGSAVKNPPANAGDMVSIPDLGKPRMPWSS